MTSSREPMTVLFVCTANICRSAYAHRRAEYLLAGRAQVVSAGTHARDGMPMDPAMASELATRGGDPEGFTSEPLTASIARSADVILTAETSHRQWILEDWPQLLPRTFTLGQFSREVERVGEGVGRDLVHGVHSLRARASRQDDISDPYRRGPAAAATCAQQIDDHLARVLPRLIGDGGASWR
ncbi:low molecular weight phosphatase family protein [Janibacter sp. GXQ6167]|uniref:arsenate-mycothiol transferase ArsC n=1 Tax=Janibacter sp. GXQ6167 TaxID=3240791 RepID=UPI00352385CE